MARFDLIAADSASDEGVGMEKVRRFSVSSVFRRPLYRLYRLSYVTGRYIERCAQSVADAFRNIWQQRFAGMFGCVAGFFRSVAELKATRTVRGELSISRGLIKMCNGIGDGVSFVFGSLASEGLVSGSRLVREKTAESVSGFWARNRRIFNYIAPIAGLSVLALTIYFWSNTTVGLTVTYNDKELGAIPAEQVYNSAARDVETKVTEASGASYALSGAPTYRLGIVKKSDLLSTQELSDSILKASSADVTSGYGLYVDNRLVGATSDSKSIQTMLDSITAAYTSDPLNEKVAFFQDVKIKAGVFPKSVQRSADNMKSIITASTKNSQTYIAQKGDSPEMVANKYHISVDQLYAMNSNVTGDSLTQGQIIKVVDSMPTLSVKYTRRQTTQQGIPFAVVSTEAPNIAKGRIQVTQGGVNGVMQVVSDVSYVGSTVVESKTVSTTTLRAPVTQQQLVGTFDYTAKANNLIGYASNFVGSSYVSGAAGPYAFDCSGYTMFIFEKFGISLPHNAAAQASYGTAVSRNNLQPGDLVFFNTYGYGIGHVGIYVGNNEFVNAENYSAGVTYCSLSGYWSNTYSCARRMW
jgi:cell wall-associated NlpC family hydrolase